MAFQIQGYKQSREIGSGVNSPRVTPSVADTGVGEAIQKFAAGVETSWEKVNRENAETESMAAASATRLALEEQYRKDQETAQPGAQNFTPEFLKKVQGATADGEKKLSSDASRKRYRERMLGFENEIGTRAITWEAGERVAKRTRDFSTAADDNANSLYTVDGAARDLTYQSLQNDLNGSLDSIGLPPSTRDQLRDEAKAKMSYAAVQGDLRDRPDKVQDWLVKGNGADYYSRLRTAESGGRNIGSDTSSAFGPYQFIKGTWTNLIKSHPELGLTEADRFNPRSQEIAIRAFTADNAASLKSAGIPLTNTNMYMAHFLGTAGGSRFIKAFGANPNDEARLHVDSGTVNANPGVFKPGRTVGDVMALFGKKFGDDITWDKQGANPAYYADIPFKQRDALYSAAETEMNKRRTQGEAAFNQRVQNTVAEFATVGVATLPPTEGEFVAALGPNRGTVAYGEFQANAQAAGASYKLQRMPLNEHGPYIESMKPEPGDKFFAEKQAGYEKVRVIGDTIRKQVTEDFGQYVIGHNDVARGLLAKAFDPQANQNEAAAAADQFAQIVAAEGQRLNVSASNRSLLPKSYSQSIAATLNQQLTSDGDAKGKVMALNAYADRWGSNWPAIYRDMKDGMSAPIQVITSRIKDKAAIILASVHDKSFEELTKTTMQGSDRKTVEEDLRTAFQPLVTSTMWQQSALPGVGVFYEQAKKLAAVYVAQGTAVSDAAEAAYQDLIGFKYRMVDDRSMNIRIPKEVDSNYMEYFLRQEMFDVLGSDRVSATNDELKADPQASERLRERMQRDGKWVSLPDNTGIGLMYRGSLRADSKGKPIVMTWDEVKAKGTQYWDDTKRKGENYETFEVQ